MSRENESAAQMEAAVPPAVRGLSLVSLLNDFASEMVYPLLPAFVTRTLGGGALVLGLIDGASELTASGLKWVSGRLSDRPGWRSPLILGGYATAVLARPLIAGASAAWQVVGLRVVDRVGKGIRTPPRDALIAAVTPLESRGRAFGFHRGADHFGAVLGSLMAWWLLREGAEVRSVIASSVIPGVVAFAVLSVVLRGGAGSRESGVRNWKTVDGSQASALDSDAPAAPKTANSPDSRLRAPDSFWPPILALTALTFFRLPETLLILRLEDQGVSTVAVPLIWAGLHVVRSASSYPGGRLSDRHGARKVVAAGGLLFAIVVFGLGMPIGPAPAIALFLLLGVVAGLTESGERSLVARLAPVRTGERFGVYHALTGLAALPAGLLFGALYQAESGPAALWVSACGMVVAVITWVSVTSGAISQRAL
ncbi:MAG TPA: MFS transporter [Gemmatimonadales bacterium]|nr:MFS transporter [Gemmatimonadales bacterium]